MYSKIWRTGCLPSLTVVRRMHTSEMQQMQKGVTRTTALWGANYAIDLRYQHRRPAVITSRLSLLFHSTWNKAKQVHKSAVHCGWCLILVPQMRVTGEIPPLFF